VLEDGNSEVVATFDHFVGMPEQLIVPNDERALSNAPSPEARTQRRRFRCATEGMPMFITYLRHSAQRDVLAA